MTSNETPLTMSMTSSKTQQPEASEELLAAKVVATVEYGTWTEAKKEMLLYKSKLYNKMKIKPMVIFVRKRDRRR